MSDDVREPDEVSRETGASPEIDDESEIKSRNVTIAVPEIPSGDRTMVNILRQGRVIS